MQHANANDKPSTLSPPLKWAGGKRWLTPSLLKLWQHYPDHRLVEPFCGGLAVALGLNPKVTLLNDINPHNISFYRWLQRGLKISLPMANDKDLYYQHRDAFNNLILKKKSHTKKAASLFYYLNRTGFNGLCRFNQQGTFNVPFGQHKTIRYLRDFSDYKSPLQSWAFAEGDFAEINLEKTDFVYADPPYDVEFTQYAAQKFYWEDQVRLVKWLAEHQGPVVLSNQATKRILKLYKSHGYQCQLIKAPRFISCNGDRQPAIEVFATKNIPKRLTKLTLGR